MNDKQPTKEERIKTIMELKAAIKMAARNPGKVFVKNTAPLKESIRRTVEFLFVLVDQLELIEAHPHVKFE